ncbi:MAG: hypothetical protein ACXAD7_28380, partial [Candidatus Kariarchaeaceae archaeon]
MIKVHGYSSNTVRPKGTLIQDVNSKDGVSFYIEDLAIAHVEHYYFKVHPNAERITIDFSDVDYGYDPEGYNSFEVHVKTPTRSIDQSYFYSINVWGDAHFEIEDLHSEVTGYVFGTTDNVYDLPLMPGYVQVVIENDWTSYDSISGKVNIKVEHGNNKKILADEVYEGTLGNHESYGF